MAAKRFSLDFTAQPDNGDLFFLSVSYDDVVQFNWSAQFYDYFFNFNTILVGSTIADTLINIKDKFDYYVANDWNLTDATCEINGNVIDFIFGNDLIDVTGNWSGQQSYDYGFATATIEEYSFPEPSTVIFNDAIVLSRSPYWFRYNPGVAFDRMVLRLYLYTGHKVDDKPASPTYTLSKYVVQAGQSTIGFDISALLNDRVQNSITTISGEGSFNTDLKDSVWCYAEADVYLVDDLLFTIEQQILAVDGFGYHTELINPDIPTPILTTNTHHVTYNNEDYPFYFLTDGLTNIWVNGVTVSYSYDSNLNSQNIGYINLAAYHDNDTAFNVELTYGATEYTHSVEHRTECRYDVLNCIFKNKFGVWQSMAFSKLSRSEYNRTSQDYQKVISNFGQYNLNSHSKRSYLTSLNQKITANTDFLPESQNELIKELLLSEFVYLKVDGVLLPVNITSNTWSEKTSHINKLIQYTMEFTISHDLMNNVK